jgi:hypothetical protein
MRRMLAVTAILYALVSVGAFSLGSSAAHAGGILGPTPGLSGNDTGGIIQVVPGIGHAYRELAASHCGRWNRYAGITSVHREYGDYIGFRCVYDRSFDPRKEGFPPPY